MPLPSVLTAEHRIEGYTNPVWLPLPVPQGEVVQVEQALVTLESRLVPATNEEILAMLTALAEYYAVKADKALETRLEMMVDDLRGYSATHINASIAEHRRKSNWFPKSAELRELCLTKQSLANVYRHRARIALGIEEAGSWAKTCLDKLKAQQERAAEQERAPQNRQVLEARLDGLAAKDPMLAGQVRKVLDAAEKADEKRRQNR